ncbi:polysaccharide deacetylase family protein [Haladaptatus sp. DYF46]|uniref:polysaccharide deacetylase family protein n=1 Tax=Haladaptatus sp. DYF46 TaxID=2886041 RepID=UPI001E400802|nr:polysaccharide deacetylase family protein [Haladaptatus sp. DYF46]
MADSTITTTRRGALRTAGLAIGGTALVGHAAAAPAASNGKLVFTYDDGPTDDYTQAYRKAHRKEGVPGCSAVPSASVGTKGSLDAARLRKLEDAGWEIMSHSVHHRALTNVAVTSDVSPGDETLRVETNLHGKLPGDELLVSDGSTSATVTVAGKGSDDEGKYLELESNVGTSFSASDGVTERYTDEILRSALGKSKRQLEGYGVTVTNIVMPYGGYGPRTQELVDEYYTAVANGGLAIDGRGQIQKPDELTLPHLSRAMFRQGKMTETELGTFLDSVADEDALGILGGHSWWRERLPASRIRTAIRMAKDRDIDIVTLRDALSETNAAKTTTTGTTATKGTATKTTTGGTNGARAAGTNTTDGVAAGAEKTRTAGETTNGTGQPGFGVVSALVGVGSAAAWKLRKK